MMIWGSLFTIALLIITNCLSVIAQACAPAPPEFQSVSIANEEAVILWEPDRQRQHFIRRADFDSTADDFGFLVPTPTQPTLTEATNSIFTKLAEITAPEIIYEYTPKSGGCSGCDFPLMGSEDEGSVMPAEGSVRVLEETRVAGFDASILEADNVNVLSKWLNDHGYPFSSNLEAWVKPYVISNWKITAFKIAKDQSTNRRVFASAVRMSFQTEQPFFPYSEPLQPVNTSYYGNRLLRIYFLSQNRVEGELGLTGQNNSQPWTAGVTAWSDWLNTNDSAVIQHLLLPEVRTSRLWRLTEFEDRSRQRIGINQPGDSDLFFSPSKSQIQQKRPPITHYVSQPEYDVTLVVLACYLFTTMSYRRF